MNGHSSLRGQVTFLENYNATKNELGKAGRAIVLRRPRSIREKYKAIDPLIKERITCWKKGIELRKTKGINSAVGFYQQGSGPR